jgi:predicted KAP-like P-loop ATPase
MARPEDFLSDAIKLIEISELDEGMQDRIQAAGGKGQLAQNMAEEMANRANSYRGTGSGSGQGKTLRFDENGNLIP